MPVARASGTRSPTLATARRAIFLLALVAANASADERFVYHDVSIEIPAPFAERISAASTFPGAVSWDDVAFVARIASGPPHDVLQFRGTVNPVKNFYINGDDAVEMEALSLQQQVYRLRTQSKSMANTPFKRVMIDGRPALRTNWAAMMNGVQLNGLLYCLIYDDRIYRFELMGPGGKPDATMLLAVRAIERIKISAAPRAK
jgi:hypothetical protein